MSAFKCCMWMCESKFQSSFSFALFFFPTRICGECDFLFMWVFRSTGAKDYTQKVYVNRFTDNLPYVNPLRRVN